MMRFQILGPLSGEIDNQPLRVSGSLRRSLLIRLLVSANRMVRTDSLIADLWISPPPGAILTLRSHMCHLRKSISSDRILTECGGYRLVVEAGELDTVLFENDVRMARHAIETGEMCNALTMLRQALSRWRGEALVDVSGAAWAFGERARLSEIRATATESLLDVQLHLGQHHEVVADAGAAVQEDPLREQRWSQLMLAQYRCGRQAEALRTYQRIRSILAKELGIEPSPRLAALERAILLQSPELAWRPERADRDGCNLR
jgi:DNA-binding SARP family transcriptional activator